MVISLERRGNKNVNSVKFEPIHKSMWYFPLTTKEKISKAGTYIITYLNSLDINYVVMRCGYTIDCEVELHIDAFCDDVARYRIYYGSCAAVESDLRRIEMLPGSVKCSVSQRRNGSTCNVRIPVKKGKVDKQKYFDVDFNADELQHRCTCTINRSIYNIIYITRE